MSAGLRAATIAVLEFPPEPKRNWKLIQVKINYLQTLILAEKSGNIATKHSRRDLEKEASTDATDNNALNNLFLAF